MKVAQIAVGMTYEDRKGKEFREVSSISNGVVYFRSGGLNKDCSAKDFADWAARPAGKKTGKKKDK
jgi:hypothetical protein